MSNIKGYVFVEENLKMDTTIEKSEKEQKKYYVYYEEIGDNIYVPRNKVKIKEILEPGLYEFIWIDPYKEYGYRKKDFTTDTLYNLPIAELQKIESDINKFWQREPKFKEYGLVHKRGVLLYGPAGNGKSAVADLLITEIINNYNGLVFKISDSKDLEIFINNFDSRVKKIEPNRKVLVIIEDIDGLVSTRSSETSLLNLLDGINQVNNIVYLATTNYPERLQQRILNRPSRFDKRYKLGYPNEEVRKVYFENVLKPHDLKHINLNTWIKQTEGLSIAHLRELVVSVIILENDFKEEIETLKGMKTIISSSQDNQNVIGFNRLENKNYEDEDDAEESNN